jgi:hypothetical protein
MMMAALMQAAQKGKAKAAAPRKKGRKGRSSKKR